MTYSRTALSLASIMVSLLLVACSNTGFDRFLDGDPIDRQLGLSREDFIDFYEPKKGEADSAATTAPKTGGSKIPALATVLAAPRPPKIGETKLVSLAVTDDVPLKDVLIELSKLADVDLELDANIRGGIAFRAKERPFNEVIERIAALGGLRYSYRHGILRVERDLPYIQNYHLDFLNVVRSSNSNVTISTDILSIANQVVGGGGGAGGGGGGGAGVGGAGGGGGGQGLATGSTTTITTEAQDDFWESMELSIRTILLYESPNFVSGFEDETLGIAGAATQGTIPAAALNTVGVGVGGAQPGGVPGAGGVGVPGQGAGNLGNQNMVGNNMFFVLNRQAGILSVAATERQHESIKSFLDNVRRSASAQVLIEAKVLEVRLQEEFQSGIDWNLIQQRVGSGSWTVGSSFGPETNEASVINFSLNPGDENANINAVVSLMERFGTTRTLSNPRLHAINNQPAVLTFAENRVFFEVTVESQGQTTNVDNNAVTPVTQSIESTRQSVPIGIIMTILPSINLDRNEVTLSVRPTLTRQVGEVVDPGSAYSASLIEDSSDSDDDGFTNAVPIVEVRELDSIMRLRSGQIMVIGGLMQQESNNSDDGVPFMSGIPFLGNLFKGAAKDSVNSELIIFIRATIVTPEGNYHETDRRVYEKFSDDPRPIAF